MASNLDETELARLEALACAAGSGYYSAHEDADASAKFAAAACNAVPALVAEVMRLLACHRRGRKVLDYNTAWRTAVKLAGMQGGESDLMTYVTLPRLKCWQPGQTLQPLPRKWAIQAYRPQPPHMPT